VISACLYSGSIAILNFEIGSSREGNCSIQAGGDISRASRLQTSA
jgi:hypothetical protein